MKIRMWLAASSALAVTAMATFTSPAHADETTYQADVGGGAAAVVSETEFRTFLLREVDYENPDSFELTVTQPRVAMGKNGGNHRAQVLNHAVGPVRAKAAATSVFGNRFGTPYAEAQATLTDVAIISGPLGAGTQIGTIDAHCRWDQSGWVATTTITNANGTKRQPLPNEQIDLPNELGFIRFNEQYTDSVPKLDADGNYVTDPNTGRVLYAETVYVSGARLHLAFHPYWYGLDIVDFDLQGVDIYLAVASCDPLKIPSLSGLSQTSSAS